MECKLKKHHSRCDLPSSIKPTIDSGSHMGAKLVLGTLLISVAGIYALKVIKSRSPVARYEASPNFDKRPKGMMIDSVVIHSTVISTMDECIRHFKNPASRVSAHYVVDRNGTIVQCVETENRAWHAGVSILEGVDQVNNFSVGIELVNLNDGIDPYTNEQYKAVASIIKHLRKRYNIVDKRIVSHKEIALPPGRKSDPKGFNFERLYSEIEICNK